MKVAALFILYLMAQAVAIYALVHQVPTLPSTF